MGFQARGYDAHRQKQGVHHHEPKEENLHSTLVSHWTKLETLPPNWSDCVFYMKISIFLIGEIKIYKHRDDRIKCWFVNESCSQYDGLFNILKPIYKRAGSEKDARQRKLYFSLLPATNTNGTRHKVINTLEMFVVISLEIISQYLLLFRYSKILMRWLVHKPRTEIKKLVQSFMVHRS